MEGSAGHVPLVLGKGGTKRLFRHRTQSIKPNQYNPTEYFKVGNFSHHRMSLRYRIRYQCERGSNPCPALWALLLGSSDSLQSVRPVVTIGLPMGPHLEKWVSRCDSIYFTYREFCRLEECVTCFCMFFL